MPRSEYDEDLFKDTTMTFGEHLEELRARLFKAIVGLIVAFVVALFFGNRVVGFIQMPLTAALTKYYQQNTLDTAREKLAKLQKDGKSLPADPEQIEQLVRDRGLLPRLIYIQPDALIAPLQKRYPGLKDFKLPEKASGQDGEGDGQPAKPPQITRDDLLRVFIWQPVEDDERVRVKTLNAQEAFVIFVKASLLLGVLAASPWIFYQIWSFVAAGLYPHEKRYVNVYLPVSLGLFLAGAAVAFFLVLEPVLEFLFSFNRWMGIDPDPRISEWLGFVLMLPLGFGIAFQLPLVMLFLDRIGIVTVNTFVGQWRLAVVVIFVLSMVLTPADPYSMFLMAVPLLILYVLGILLCKFMSRNRSPYDDDFDEENKRRRTRRTGGDKKADKAKADTAGQSQAGRSWFVLKMVLAAALVALLVAWRPLKEAAQQRAAVAGVEQLGGKVFYDYQVDKSGKHVEGAQPSGWGVLRALLGPDLYDTVVEVDLSGTEAGDAALEPLGGLPGLKKLDLRGTKVSEPAVEELKATLPNCQVASGPK